MLIAARLTEAQGIKLIDDDEMDIERAQLLPARGRGDSSRRPEVTNLPAERARSLQPQPAIEPPSARVSWHTCVNAINLHELPEAQDLGAK